MQPEASIPSGLPTPGRDALVHSERTAAFIQRKLEEEGGRLSFGEFMHLALYAPGHGYYAAGAEKFGAEGDFVTAPEVSTLFGRVVAQQCAEALSALGGGSVLELGAGSGALAMSMIDRLAELNVRPERYQILDVSADLVARQQARLLPLAERHGTPVEWLDRMPESLNGVVIANEVVDALPVERFRCSGGKLEQQFVVPDGAAFAPLWAPASEAVQAAVAEIEAELGRAFPEGYQSEVSLALSDWVGQLAGSLGDGILLLFDYGLPRHEYYAMDRGQGWLQCHFRHHAHRSPLIYPGIQDLTAWVDFTAVAHAAARNGLEVAGFVTQAMFLLNGGLDNEFQAFDALSQVDQLRLSQEAKRLTLPTEMGENFKCLGLRRPGGPSLSAFAQQDRTPSL